MSWYTTFVRFLLTVIIYLWYLTPILRKGYDLNSAVNMSSTESENVEYIGKEKEVIIVGRGHEGPKFKLKVKLITVSPVCKIFSKGI